jgi:hypothetical protein
MIQASVEVEETDQHIVQAEIGKLILRVLVYNRLRGLINIKISTTGPQCLYFLENGHSDIRNRAQLEAKSEDAK